MALRDFVCLVRVYRIASSGAVFTSYSNSNNDNDWIVYMVVTGAAAYRYSAKGVVEDCTVQQRASTASESMGVAD